MCDAEVLAPHVLFLIAHFALSDRDETEKANTAPHKAFLAYRPYAALVAYPVQQRQLMGASVRRWGCVGRNSNGDFVGTVVYRIPNGKLHRGDDYPAVILEGESYLMTTWYCEGVPCRDKGMPSKVMVGNAGNTKKTWTDSNGVVVREVLSKIH